MRRLSHALFVCALMLVVSSCGNSGTAGGARTAKDVAQLLTPANGQTGVNPIVPVQFSWNSVGDALSYMLYVGTNLGAKDVYSSGEVTTNSISVNLASSTTYYARLWTKKNSGWFQTDSSFSTGLARVGFVSPVTGAVGVDPFAPITWSPVAGADLFDLVISTQPNANDLYFSYPMPANVNSRLPWGLAPGTTYYATLRTMKAGTWSTTDSIQFTTRPADPLPDKRSFYAQVANLTAQVRAMTVGSSNLAAPGTDLYQVLLNRSKDPTQPVADCTDYAFALLNSFTTNRVLARYRGIGLDGRDTHAITEYWDPFTKGWTVADSTFGVIYFDNVNQSGWSADMMGDAIRSGNVASVPWQYVSPYYDTFMRNYYMDPITLFNNLNPVGSNDFIGNAVHEADPLLNLVDINEAGQENIYTAKFGGSAESFTVQNGSAGAYTFSPELPSLWAHPHTLHAGWSASDPQPSDMQLYTYKWLSSYGAIAHLSHPLNADVVDSWDGIQFSWTAIPNAITYRLQIGREFGRNDVYDSHNTQTTANTVALQPSSNYYVRLWTELGSQWYYDDTSFSSLPSIAHLTMPSDGEDNVVPSPAQFNWTPVSNATYYLYVGTAPGLKDAYDSGELQGSSVSVQLNGKTTYYVRMWTKLDSTWYYSDSWFQTK